MQKTICAACGEGGGTFILRGGKWYHKNRCVAPVAIRDVKSTFPFSTSTLEPNDGPVTFENIQQLRRAENLHGVACDPYSNSQSYQGERY